LSPFAGALWTSSGRGLGKGTLLLTPGGALGMLDLPHQSSLAKNCWSPEPRLPSGISPVGDGMCLSTPAPRHGSDPAGENRLTATVWWGPLLLQNTF
uniref:Uncharacterized protein n=1 Tax=Athene cunicularia TaxID=194338 RepID=A0A663NDI5_ATHCN